MCVELHLEYNNKSLIDLNCFCFCLNKTFLLFSICLKNKNLLKFLFQVDVITGRQYTYAELRDSSAALAVRFQTKFKLGKGDVVAICLPNLPEYPGAVLGAIEAGLTVTTVNPIYTAGKRNFKKDSILKIL